MHHDKSAAQGQGLSDVIMNILTTNGYVSRFVTDWAGPETILRKIAIRLGSPAIPGQVLRFTGQVASATQEGDEGVVETMCRPVGKVRFGEELLDAAAEGEYIDVGQDVRLVHVDGNRLVVERISEA